MWMDERNKGSLGNWDNGGFIESYEDIQGKRMCNCVNAI